MPGDKIDNAHSPIDAGMAALRIAGSEGLASPSSSSAPFTPERPSDVDRDPLNMPKNKDSVNMFRAMAGTMPELPPGGIGAFLQMSRIEKLKLKYEHTKKHMAEVRQSILQLALEKKLEIDRECESYDRETADKWARTIQAAIEAKTEPGDVPKPFQLPKDHNSKENGTTSVRYWNLMTDTAKKVAAYELHTEQSLNVLREALIRNNVAVTPPSSECAEEEPEFARAGSGRVTLDPKATIDPKNTPTPISSTSPGSPTMRKTSFTSNSQKEAPTSDPRKSVLAVGAKERSPSRDPRLARKTQNPELAPATVQASSNAIQTSQPNAIADPRIATATHTPKEVAPSRDPRLATFTSELARTLPTMKPIPASAVGPNGQIARRVSINAGPKEPPTSEDIVMTDPEHEKLFFDDKDKGSFAARSRGGGEAMDTSATSGVVATGANGSKAIETETNAASAQLRYENDKMTT